MLGYNQSDKTSYLNVYTPQTAKLSECFTVCWVSENLCLQLTEISVSLRFVSSITWITYDKNMQEAIVCRSFIQYNDKEDENIKRLLRRYLPRKNLGPLECHAEDD